MDAMLARLRSHRPRQANPPGAQPAAVAVIIAPGREILLVRRAVHESDRWSGHMALPGGRFELGDRDLLATAIRETREEVGVALGEDALLGVLDDLAPRAPTLPPVVVRPFVFGLPARPEARPSGEIAGVRWFSLDSLAASAAEAEVDVDGARARVPAFVPETGCVIWGMTHRILSGLLALAGA